MSDLDMDQLTWREWLLTDEPTSRRHARLANFYQGWLSYVEILWRCLV